MTKPKSKVLVVLQIVMDVFVFVMVGALLTGANKFLKPPERGIHCNDATIDYPRLPDTVTNKMLLVSTLCLPIIVILLLELYHKVLRSRTPGSGLRMFALSAFKLIAMFLYGAGVTCLIMLFIKMIAGRLRPHFLATCQPDIHSLNCTHHYRHYIPHVQCNDSVSEADIVDARTSFPSGHATLAFYAATFLAIYLERRLVLRFSALLKSLLQVVLFLAAVYVTISRVTDNRHHATDVIAGGLLGLVTGSLTIIYLPHHMRFETGLNRNQGEDYEEIADFVYVPKMYKKRDSLESENTNHDELKML